MELYPDTGQVAFNTAEVEYFDQPVIIGAEEIPDAIAQIEAFIAGCDVQLRAYAEQPSRDQEVLLHGVGRTKAWAIKKLAQLTGIAQELGISLDTETREN